MTSATAKPRNAFRLATVSLIALLLMGLSLLALGCQAQDEEPTATSVPTATEVPTPEGNDKVAGPVIAVAHAQPSISDLDGDFNRESSSSRRVVA